MRDYSVPYLSSMVTALYLAFVPVTGYAQSTIAQPGTVAQPVKASLTLDQRIDEGLRDLAGRVKKCGVRQGTGEYHLLVGKMNFGYVDEAPLDSSTSDSDGKIGENDILLFDLGKGVSWHGMIGDERDGKGRSKRAFLNALETALQYFNKFQPKCTIKPRNQ